MSRICVFVFFATSAASMLFSLRGVDVNGALGLAMVASGVGALPILINGTAALLNPVVNMVFGPEPKHHRAASRRTAAR